MLIIDHLRVRKGNFTTFGVPSCPVVPQDQNAIERNRPWRPFERSEVAFLHRRRFDSAFWDIPTGHIPPPTERSYPQSICPAIEEYAALYGAYLAFWH